MIWDVEIEAKLEHIIWLLKLLLKKDREIMIDLTNLNAAVAANTTVDGSVEVLIDQLVALVKAIPTTDPTTQAQIDALTATLTANNTAIAAKVVAGTPAA